MASYIDTDYGRINLIDILQPADNNIKFAGMKQTGRRMWVYSDMPFNHNVEWNFNGQHFSCMGTCAMHCPKCYAEKMVLYGPHVGTIATGLARRTWIRRNAREAWLDGMRRRLRTLRAGDIVRMYGAGDFLNQDTVDDWTALAIEFPHLFFYGYTKKGNLLDFSRLIALPNVNIIFGLITVHGVTQINYGAEDKVISLADSIGAHVCPCGMKCNKGRHNICMVECDACLHRSDILFPIH